MLNTKKLFTKILERLAASWDLSRGTEIPKNANLNDYKTFGSYWVSATNASTLSNSPTTGTFRLIVMGSSSAASGRIQIAIGVTANTNYPVFFRYYNGSTWYPWGRMACV